MSTFQPPPTWALPVLLDEATGKSQFNPIWLKWFVDMAGVLSRLGAGDGFIDHNLLGNVQGGSAGEYYHLTATEHDLMEQNASFPVGTIFTTVSASNPFNLLGYGTWTAFGAGRVLIGVDTGDVDFDTVEETGSS